MILIISRDKYDLFLVRNNLTAIEYADLLIIKEKNGDYSVVKDRYGSNMLLDFEDVPELVAERLYDFFEYDGIDP